MEQHNDNHFAAAAMLIRKSIDGVFDAFVDPDITTQFWFSKSSGRLEEGSSITWTWEQYKVSVPVKVLELNKNKRIVIQWSDDPDSLVTWDFQNLGKDKTFVTITNTGFKGDQESLISQIRDATGGFTWVLAGLKALLEYNIKLNLVGDRYPPELNAE